MTSDTVKGIVGISSLAVAMCIAGGAFGASYARADTGSYLSTIDDHGVYYADAAKAVDAGKAVCAKLRQGVHVLAIRQYMTTHGFAPHDASWVIGSAVAELCPDMAAVVQAEITDPRGRLA